MAKKKVNRFPISFETFRLIGEYELNNLKNDNPSSFNGFVSIKKFKVSIEEIQEPKEVLISRLQELWDKCDNWHHWKPLKTVAKELDYELKGSPGNSKETK